MAAESNAKLVTATNVEDAVLAVNNFLAENTGWNAVEGVRFYQGIGWGSLCTKPS